MSARPKIADTGSLGSCAGVVGAEGDDDDAGEGDEEGDEADVEPLDATFDGAELLAEVVAGFAELAVYGDALFLHFLDAAEGGVVDGFSGGGEAGADAAGGRFFIEEEFFFFQGRNFFAVLVLDRKSVV